MESSEGLAKYNERQILKNPNSVVSSKPSSPEVQATNSTQNEPQRRSFLDKLLGRNKPQPVTTTSQEVTQQPPATPENTAPNPMTPPSATETEKPITSPTPPNAQPIPITVSRAGEVVGENAVQSTDVAPSEEVTPNPASTFETLTPSNISQFSEQNQNDISSLASQGAETPPTEKGPQSAIPTPEN